MTWCIHCNIKLLYKTIPSGKKTKQFTSMQEMIFSLYLYKFPQIMLEGIDLWYTVYSHHAKYIYTLEKNKNKNAFNAVLLLKVTVKPSLCSYFDLILFWSCYVRWTKI